MILLVITLTNDVIRQLRKEKTLNKIPSAATKPFKRSLKNELFGSWVWLYAKLITPLLLLTIFSACALIYWRLTAFDRPGINGILLVLGLMFIAINAVIILFSNPRQDGFPGVEVSREDVPLIWAEIDRISQHASCPPIETLFINDEFNASAAHSKLSRFSMKERLEVTIGLPLMAALTPEECATVIAHEIGHHNGDDTRRGLVVAQAFVRASEIIDMKDQEGMWLLCAPTSFIFSAYRTGLWKLSQKLRHQCEFDADAFAASVCDLDACGRTEVAINLFSDDIHHVLWEPVMDAYRNGREVPENLFDNLPERFTEALASDMFKGKLDVLLKEETDPHSSHPSMKDRLAYIGASASLPSFDPEQVATRVWLGVNYSTISKRLQDEWLADFKERAGDEFLYIRQLKARADRIFAETESVLREVPNDRDALLARCAMAGTKMSGDDSAKFVAEAAKICPNEPEIEYMQAETELANDNVLAIDRLFSLIEHFEGGMSESALNRLNDLLTTKDDWQEDFPNLANALSSDELVDVVADINSRALLRHKEAVEWKDWEVTRAVFPEWQENAIIDFCDYQERIERLWIFSALVDEEQMMPRYFILANYENDVQFEMLGCISEHDPLTFPLRGLCNSMSVVCGFGAIKGFATTIAMPKQIASIINDTEPLYQNGVTKRRLNDVKLGEAEAIQVEVDQIQTAA